MEKNGWSWIIVLIVFFALLLYFTGFVSGDSQCQSNDPICFQNETVSKQIGSYIMVDANGRFLQSNQWKNSIDLFFNGEGCIYPLKDTQTIFYANWQKGWYWEPKTDIFGYQCFKLKK